MHDMQNVSVDVMLTQMTSKKGIKIHNESAIASMYKEYTQLEEMKVMVVLDPESLTKSKTGDHCE